MDKVKGFWGKVKDFFKNMSKKMRIVLGVTGAVLIIGIIAFVIWANSRPYEVLITGLSNSGTSSVLSFLSENGVTDYKVDGDSVLVPADRVDALKGQLALAGYPKYGYMFDIYFDKVGSLTTSKEEDRTWLIGLEQKLNSVICTLDGIQDAVVSITLGKSASYVLGDSSTESKASVSVTMAGGTKLSNQYVNAISGLIAYAVEGLNVDNVLITDQFGNSYVAGDLLGNVSEASELKMLLEQQTSASVQAKVMQVLGDLYGEDNVKVAASCTVDVSRKVIEDTTYTQPDGAPDGAGLIGSQTWYWQVARDGIETVGGVVGTASNSEIPTYVNNGGALDGDEDYAAGQGSSEHDNNKRVEQSEGLAGTITDVGVAVTINANADNAWSVDEATLRSHIAAAANIGGENPENRVSVLIAPFNVEKLTPATPLPLLPVPEYVLYIAAGLLLLLLLLIIVLIITGKKRKKKKQKMLEEQQLLLQEQGQGGQPLTLEEAEAVAAAAAAAAAAAGGAGADIMDINTEKSMELRKNVRQFAQNNPEIAAQMIKNWLKGGDDNG